MVDEEHDPAYKQDEGVHYHARDMAVVRARAAKAPLVLSSATPSVETEVNARRGRYRRLSLPDRFGGQQMPEVEIIDLRREGPARGRFVAPRLALAVGEAIERGEQALLFLNRRGYAPLTLCRACGFRLQCPHCDAWLVEHRFRRQLVCHHCGYGTPAPNACPKCQAAGQLHRLRTRGRAAGGRGGRRCFPMPASSCCQAISSPASSACRRSSPPSPTANSTL